MRIALEDTRRTRRWPLHLRMPVILEDSWPLYWKMAVAMENLKIENFDALVVGSWQCVQCTAGHTLPTLAINPHAPTNALKVLNFQFSIAMPIFQYNGLLRMQRLSLITTAIFDYNGHLRLQRPSSNIIPIFQCDAHLPVR
jgi:hypothetical protein